MACRSVLAQYIRGWLSRINISIEVQIWAQVTINAAKGPARRRLDTDTNITVHESSGTITGDRSAGIHIGHARIGTNDNTGAGIV